MVMGDELLRAWLNHPNVTIRRDEGGAALCTPLDQLSQITAVVLQTAGYIFHSGNGAYFLSPEFTE